MAGPLLLDILMSKGRNSIAGGPMPKAVWDRLLHAKYNAQRFVFDEEASEIAGTFAIDCPDLVFSNRQFAVPPYPMTYTEIDAKAFFRGHNTGPKSDAAKDDRLAYLVDGADVYVLFHRNADGHEDVGTALWRYRVVAPGNNAGPGDVHINIDPVKHKFLMDELYRAGKKVGLADMRPETMAARLQRHMRANVMFGSAINTITGKRGKDLIEATRECAIYWLDPTSVFAKRGVDADLMSGFMGDVRNYLALMLWLNQQTKVVTIGMPGGRVLVRGKPMTYMAHNTVQITLGRCKTVRRAFMLANERNGPRRHGVKGHYRHKHGRDGCPHKWPLLPNDDGHYVCKTCGRVRWRVEAFERGDAAKGYVTHDYAVGGPEDGC